MKPKSALAFFPALVLLQGAFAQICLRSAQDAALLAQKNDRALAARRQYVQEEARLAKLSLSPFLPEFDFSISDSACAESASGGYKKKSLEAGITQKVFNGGKTFLEYKMQRQKAFYDFLQFESEEKIQKNKAVQSYYDTLFAKLARDVMLEAKKIAESVLLVADLEMAQGMISKTDYLESKINFMEISANAKNASDDYSLKLRRFRETLGVGVEEEIIFLEECQDVFEQKTEAVIYLRERVSQMTQSALKKSVELKKARAETDWARKSLSMQRKAFLPSVAFRAGFAFSGRNYPLTEPSYSFKVILGFDNNPWLPMTISKSAGLRKGELNSVSDAASAKGIINTSWFSQMKLLKINGEQTKLEAQSVERQVEDKVFELAQSVENANQSALLSLETLKLKERKLSLYQMELEQGQIKKSDYLEALNDFTAEKINYLKARANSEILLKELQDMI